MNPLSSISRAVFVLSALLLTTVAWAAEPMAPFAPPAEAALPSDPRGDAIRAGKLLLTETKQRLPKNVGNGLNCSNCHLNAGRTQFASPWVGVWGVYPQYRSRNTRMSSLQERVNDCFERSLNGRGLALDSAEMNAIMAYMQWLSTGVPTGARVEGHGFGPIGTQLQPDATHGKTLYAAKCARCHGPNGAGQKISAEQYAYPPLWGKDSFNIGAGMARTYSAAAFIKHNMPLGAGNTLNDQDAIDIAEFVTHQPRPAFPAAAHDWPKGDKPKDARN
ncbi:MAG: c-type cytochrome [Gammaproteobacteria bacterium]